MKNQPAILLLHRLGMHIAALLLPAAAYCQVVLNANGPGNTYEDINAVLAPDGDVIEVPDCSHPDFGRHIEEIFDDELGMYVFQFHIHVDEDDDRCINFDRQRNEIKSYGDSPNNLKATLGEEVLYKWKFKLDIGFQPSSAFTHLHQIKAVGGSEDAMPNITLTARKGSPDNLELRYAESTSQETLIKESMEEMKGEWLQVEERIVYGDGADGAYFLYITKVATGDTLMQYEDTSLRMWKTDASFIRPKWGIYRSLNDSENLRDERVLFADFSIEELTPLSVENAKKDIAIFPNPAKDYLHLAMPSNAFYEKVNIFDSAGRTKLSLPLRETIDIQHLPAGIYFLQLTTAESTSSTYTFIKK